MESGAGFSVKLAMGGEPSQALAGEGQPVGVVHQAVEDDVGQGGVADHVVPLLDGDLAGDEGGAAAVAVLENLQEVDALAGRKDG